MVVLCTISDFGLLFVAAGVISFIALVIIPADETLPGLIFGIVAVLAVAGIIIAGTMHHRADYWAYRYDKVIAKRENVISACPDMSKHLCLETYRAYQRDSVEAYEKYMTMREK